MIHNDHSKGSVHIFTDDQISLIENVAKQADASFALVPTSSVVLNMAAVLADTDIYLIPYEEYIEHRRVWCNSAFAQKMRAKHDAAIEELEKRKDALGKMQEIILQSEQTVDKDEIAHILEEIKKEKELIDIIYRPWTSCPHVFSTTLVYETPLGYFVPETREAFICLDGIISKYPSMVESIALLTLFHELGHATMHYDGHKLYESAFEYWAEEALANKIALQTISASHNFIPSLLSHAKKFVQMQPKAYALGYKLYEHNLLDWYALKNNKSNLNKWGTECWLKIVTNEGITSDNIYEVQKAFYVAVSINDMIYLDGCTGPMRDITIKAFDAWLKFKSGLKNSKSRQIYCANILSKHIGFAYRVLMEWEYDTLVDCCSSYEVNLLRSALKQNNVAKHFNLGTRGNSQSAASQYYNFLTSVGL